MGEERVMLMGVRGSEGEERREGVGEERAAMVEVKGRNGR